MKKITLQIFSFLCLISTLSFGQTYTSGLFSIGSVVDGQIDINVTSNLVTLTLIGPSSGYLAMGFDTFGHDSKDVVIFDNVTLTDRKFTNSLITPTLDANQDWTVITDDDTTNPGTRTVVATRARDTGDSDDYVFPMSPTTLNVVGAYRTNFTIGFHTDFDATGISFSLLGLDDVNKIQFTMSPNPATSNLKVVLPSSLTNSRVEIFDMLARKIFDGKMTNTHFSIIDVSAWNSGVYLVKVSNNDSLLTKRFIKQ